jgi:hypothetical protein
MRLLVHSVPFVPSWPGLTQRGEVYALGVAAAMAAVLLWAALSKITHLPGVASTVEALGIPGAWSRRVAVGIAVSETITALAIVFAPQSAWTATAILVLGATFALAGLIALLRKEQIRCNCFGLDSRGSYLGFRQMLALPAWLAGAWILYSNPLPLTATAPLFAVVGVINAALKALSLRRWYTEARGDRISAEQMYLWLPRH